MASISISKTTRRAYPKLPYEKLKDDILGKNYELSLVFIGTKRARKLNQTYRKKDYVPNVLSYPLTKTTGEIFITPSVAKTESKKFSMTPRNYVAYLFIHACLHLKGHHHGATMERAEQRFCKKYRLC